MHDKFVRWLQILLNQRKVTGTALKEDGFFGPKTLAAVNSFQRSVSLTPDGVVGMQTWLKLLAGGEAAQQRGQAALKTSSASPVPVAALVPQQEKTPPVSDWSLKRRFEEVLRLSPSHMPGELAAQFRGMLTPVNIGILVGTLTAWAVSHAFGVGEIADIVLAVVGAVFLGLGVFRAGEHLGQCLMTTIHAETPMDLDAAADDLAQAVVILGVVTFFAVIAKVGAKFGKAASAEEEAGGATAGSEAKSATEPSKPRARDEPAPRPKKPVDTISAKFVDRDVPVSQRQKVAADWYSQHPGMTPEKAASRASGFDPDRPMQITTKQPGEKIAMWVRNDGSPGIDATTPETDPATLGLKIDPETGLPANRHLEVYEVTKPLQVLQGSAADFPEGVAPLVGGKGGGTQIALPPDWQSSVAVTTSP